MDISPFIKEIRRNKNGVDFSPILGEIREGRGDAHPSTVLAKIQQAKTVIDPSWFSRKSWSADPLPILRRFSNKVVLADVIFGDP